MVADRFTFVPISGRKEVEREIGHRAARWCVELDGKPYLAVSPTCWDTVRDSRPKCPRCGAKEFESKSGLAGVRICSSCGHVGPE
jgi:hypothetical protein